MHAKYSLGMIPLSVEAILFWVLPFRIQHQRLLSVANEGQKIRLTIVIIAIYIKQQQTGELVKVWGRYGTEKWKTIPVQSWTSTSTKGQYGKTVKLDHTICKPRIFARAPQSSPEKPEHLKWALECSGMSGVLWVLWGLWQLMVWWQTCGRL